MKGKKITLLVSISMVLVLLTSLVLAACAQEAAAPGAPTRISPQVPVQTQPGVTITPAKPAPTPAPAPSAEVIKLSVQLHTAAGSGIWYDFHSTVLPRLVEEGTNGRITMGPIYGAGELVTADQALEAAATGLVDFVEASPSYWKGTIPVAEIETGLPVAWQNPTEFLVFMYKRGMAEILEEAYAEKNIKWLSSLITKMNMVMVTKDKISSLADFQGTKIITFGPYLPIVDKIGGAGTYIVLAERYTSVATGVADGVLTTPVWMYDNKFYEVTSYYVQPSFQGAGADQYIMNMDKWNSLPEDLQKTFLLATRWTAVNWMMDVGLMEYNIKNKWVEKGIEVVTWSETDWNVVVAAAAEYWDEVATKDKYTARAITIMKDLIRELGRLE